MEKKGQYDYLVKALKGADEVQARRFAAAMALGIGWGGISRIVELTGMSHSTIERGIKEIQDQERIEKPEKLRADGGGRKKVELKDQKIITSSHQDSDAFRSMTTTASRFPQRIQMYRDRCLCLPCHHFPSHHICHMELPFQ